MWGYFCLLAVILILLVEIIFSIVVTLSFSSNAERRVELIGREAAENIETLQSNLERYRAEGVIVYLITENGEIILPENAPSAENDEWLIVELSNRVSTAAVGTEISFRYGDRINCAEVVEFNGERCFVLVSYSLQLIKVSVRHMQLYFLLVGVILLLIALLISYAFSTKLTSGLKNMSDTAVRLAKGDYTVQFTNADFSEMAQLSDTLNYVRDEVKKSEDFRHEILANVTHDLKTPLTMIKAYASMIKEISGDNKEKRDKHLQVIIDEADRLTGLVNDVLSVSKISSNMDEINPKVFNLTELLYGIINKFGYLQEAQGYSFMLDIEQNLYTRADEEKISQ
ncbi:MAG: HAMP domain-containing histidine kinase, partial [Clostridia bacterium]|nr:HAMP domain-containing histidine kinase [Clostridia bacterium]